MRIIHTDKAVADVRSAFRYIAREAGENIAENILTRVRGAITSLAKFPEQGRVGRVKSTHELLISKTPFIAAYRVLGDEIQILSVIHTARRWPENFK